MNPKLEKFLLWLGDFVEDGENGRPSVKRYGLALAVTVLCGVMLGFGFVIAMSIKTSNGRDQVDMVRIAADSLEVITFAVLTAVSGTYLIDKASARKSNNTEKKEDV